jgi:hypothetical protein
MTLGDKKLPLSFNDKKHSHKYKDEVKFSKEVAIFRPA